MLEFPKILKLISVRHLNGVIDEIEKGADVNVRDKLGRQPIHHAAKLKNASRPFFDLLFETGSYSVDLLIVSDLFIFDYNTIY